METGLVGTGTREKLFPGSSRPETPCDRPTECSGAEMSCVGVLPTRRALRDRLPCG